MDATNAGEDGVGEKAQNEQFHQSDRAELVPDTRREVFESDN